MILVIHSQELKIIQAKQISLVWLRQLHRLSICKASSFCTPDVYFVLHTLSSTGLILVYCVRQVRSMRSIGRDDSRDWASKACRFVDTLSLAENHTHVHWGRTKK